MITTLCTHDGKKWAAIGTLADIHSDIDTDKLDFSLRGIGAYPVSELSTTCPRTYRIRHKTKPTWDIFYEFDAVVAAFDEEGDILTLKLTSEPTEPTRWTE